MEDRILCRLKFPNNALILLYFIGINMPLTDAFANPSYDVAPHVNSHEVLFHRHRRDVTSAVDNQPFLVTSTSAPIVKHIYHDYYRYFVTNGCSQCWEDILERKGVRHPTLSDSHRTAARIQLKFVFPFYGHKIRQVTIATGGFVYVSDFLHQWLTATQYVAPLMANFDTRLGNSSNIHYFDSGSKFIVQWENIHIQKFPVGGFNFQVHMENTGKIIFCYKDVPMNISTLPSTQHPVKIGLSDAYYFDRRKGIKPDLIPTGSHPMKIGLSDAFYVDATTSKNSRRRTIYEYHRVEVAAKDITNNTCVEIEPLKTCNLYTNCDDCLSAININFTCSWCAAARRCSSGIDRMRQNWLENKCHEKKIKYAECSNLNPHQRNASVPVPKPQTAAAGGGLEAQIVVIIIAVLLLILIIVAFVGWVVYAYLNPSSKSGLWLIEHRPRNLRSRFSSGLQKVQFWKRRENQADKYEVSVHPPAVDDSSQA